MLEEQKDDLDKALALVRSKLKQQPNDPQLLYVLADTIVQKNPDANSPEFDEAVAAVRKAVRLQPNLVNARDTLAKLYLQEGKIEPAIEESRASLHYDAADQVALYHLIVGLRKTGNTSALPELSKRLAELRLKATREEQEHNRYKLVEQSQQADTQKR
jgi:tetratricopeptide (TPR) repeat protein